MHNDPWKKICCLLAAALLTAGTLCACGAQPAPTEKTQQSTAGNTTTEAVQTQAATTAENLTEAPTETEALTAAAPETTAPEPETTTTEPAPSWPEKEILLVCTGGVGGITDTIAHSIETAFNSSWGNYTKVINIAGDSWTGYEEVLAAESDGYKLALALYPGLISTYVKKSDTPAVTYRDFTNIAGMIKNPYVILVMKDSPYQSLQDLIAAGKEKARNIAVLNSGDVGAMLVQKLNKCCETQFKAYGCANRAEEESFMTSTLGAAIAPAASFYNRDGYRVLAVLDSSPSSVFPDAPLIDQTGIAELQGFCFQARYGLIAPAGLDQEAADRIGQALTDLGNDANFLTMIQYMGYDFELLQGDEYTAYLQSVEDDFMDYYAGNR